MFSSESLAVISVNIWQILISLANLLILFLIIKKLLFKPVKRVLAKRQETLDESYRAAEEANTEAQKKRDELDEKLSDAQNRADEILKDATDNAKYRGEKIVEEAQERADTIIRVAQNEAELERKKASDSIKREIVNVSSALTEKMLEREINTEDHRALIDSFIEDIGDDNE